MNGRDYFEDLDIDGRIILKCIWNTYDFRVWTWFFSIRTVTGSCEECDETLFSIKDEDFGQTERLSAFQKGICSTVAAVGCSGCWCTASETCSLKRDNEHSGTTGLLYLRNWISRAAWINFTAQKTHRLFVLPANTLCYNYQRIC
jgi:hypothetical protein